MLSDELKSLHLALGSFLGKLNATDAEYLRQIRRNLDAAAEQAGEMEKHFYPGEAL